LRKGGKKKMKVKKEIKERKNEGDGFIELTLRCHTIACTVLEDICDKPIRIQSYCAVARLHGV
jgi:hypothetical protein